MNKGYILAAYRLFFAALVLSAVITQLVYGVQHIDGFRVVNFLSFFTIESNIFGVVVFLVAAKAVLTGKRDTTLDYIRGAATLYMVITGIIYAVLLSGADVQTPLPWVNAVLHYIFPVAILLDWIIDSPKRQLQTKKTLLWLSFPIAYFVYSLIRGAFVHWYPYPFLNVTEQGYAKVALNSAVIAIFAIFLNLAIASIPRIKFKR